MTRFIPHPRLVLVLVAIWLLLTSFSVGQAVLGTAIALVAGWAFSAIEPESSRLRRIWPMVRLFGIVGVDIIRSNIAVATLILTRDRHGQRNSAFVEIPLRLTDPTALSLLAIIVTATPGTAWIEHDSEKNILLLHVFDMLDDSDWHRIIADRYETLLLEAFT